jgi:hypothetical protein
MWDRYDMDPRENRAFMEHLAREIRDMRHDMAEVLRELREAQFVRMRLERDMPGYWDDSVRLGKVRKRIGEAL